MPGIFKVEFDEAELARAIVRPRYLPAVSEATIGGDGTIWLRRSAVPGRTVEYLVLGRDGAAAETITVAKAERTVEARGSTVWAKSVDPDGTAVIRVYSLGSRP